MKLQTMMILESNLGDALIKNHDGKLQKLSDHSDLNGTIDHLTHMIDYSKPRNKDAKYSDKKEYHSYKDDLVIVKKYKKSLEKKKSKVKESYDFLNSINDNIVNLDINVDDMIMFEESNVQPFGLISEINASQIRQVTPQRQDVQQQAKMTQTDVVKQREQEIKDLEGSDDSQQRNLALLLKKQVQLQTQINQQRKQIEANRAKTQQQGQQPNQQAAGQQQGQQGQQAPQNNQAANPGQTSTTPA